jgi:hypothetical protein
MNIDEAVESAMSHTGAAEDIEQDSDSTESRDSAPDTSESNGRGSTRSFNETNLERVTKGAYQRIFGKDDASGARANLDEKRRELNSKAQRSAQDRPAQDRQATPDTSAPPQSWEGIGQHWNNLPATVRAEIHKRELDFRNAFAQDHNKVAFVRALEEVVAPHAAHWQQKNIDPRIAIRDGYTALATLHFGSNADKVELLRQAVKAFGIQLPGQSQRGQQPQAMRDPRVDQLLHEQQQQQIRAQQVHQAAEQQKWRAANDQIETFAKDSKSFPHFMRVQGSMANLLQTGKAADLRSAYEIAVAADKGLQAQLATEQTKERGMTLASSRPSNLPRVMGKDRAQKVEDVALATYRKTIAGATLRKV